MKKIGVYSITNVKNNKVYVGQSLDIDRRWNEHIESLNNVQHENYKLQADWMTFGKDVFNFKVEFLLEDAPVDISRMCISLFLIWKENTHIILNNSIEKGYNIEDTMAEVMDGNKRVNDWGGSRPYLKGIIDSNGEKFYKYKGEDKKRKVTIDEIISQTLKEYDTVDFYGKFWKIGNLCNKLTFVSSPRVFKLLCENLIIYKVKEGYYPVDKSDLRFKIQDSSNMNHEQVTILVEKEYIKKFIIDNISKLIVTSKITVVK